MYKLNLIKFHAIYHHAHDSWNVALICTDYATICDRLSETSLASSHLQLLVKGS